MTPLSCAAEATWEHGNSLINYMKMADINGITGRVKFDENGERTDFELEIVELKKHGLDKVRRYYQCVLYNLETVSMSYLCRYYRYCVDTDNTGDCLP